jgi:hypothetical protein
MVKPQGSIVVRNAAAILGFSVRLLFPPVQESFDNQRVEMT